MGTKWRDYKEIVAEAQAEGPEAVAHLKALSAYYRAHARMLGIPLGEVRQVTRSTAVLMLFTPNRTTTDHK